MGENVASDDADTALAAMVDGVTGLRRALLVTTVTRAGRASQALVEPARGGTPLVVDIPGSSGFDGRPFSSVGTRCAVLRDGHASW